MSKVAGVVLVGTLVVLFLGSVAMQEDCGGEAVVTETVEVGGESVQEDAVAAVGKEEEAVFVVPPSAYEVYQGALSQALAMAEVEGGTNSEEG
eukprot:CAMPEP_0119129840 /NCGR_PEP_ID=MMETSP1310-20130426/7422_1 /TAXON_ID=464262 /ORGANISM="Genus nov. species nov., Strain RCC2339" /LENGTH=92 /DNA_ID=CAMNT_0007120295 /DNA_START=54 /DNA_END=329 /DNA_ORIENTATION=-